MTTTTGITAPNALNGLKMTPEELKNQVRNLISKAKTKDAMDVVATWAHGNNQEQLKNDVALLKGDYTDLTREKTLGLLSNSEANIRLNQMANNILNLVNSYEQKGSSELKEHESDLDLNEFDIRVIKAIGSFSFEPQDRLVMERSGLTYKEFQDSLANLKSQEIAYIFSDGNQRKIKTLDNFHKAHRLIKKEEKEISKVHHNTKPAIYFSYAWGDDDETGESREKIVQELYESLKMDGYNVVRDKEDVGYKGSISDFMKTIGKGNSIIVAISDKYLKSENCMFEMYEIFRNAKLEKEGFIEKIYPIRIESIRLSDPLVLDTYFEHWEKKEKDWEQLIVKRGTRISSEQQEQYRRIKAIAHELGDFLAFLNDINAKTKADLSKNNFEEIKKAITKRVNE